MISIKKDLAQIGTDFGTVIAYHRVFEAKFDWPPALSVSSGESAISARCHLGVCLLICVRADDSGVDICQIHWDVLQEVKEPLPPFADNENAQYSSNHTRVSLL